MHTFSHHMSCYLTIAEVGLQLKHVHQDITSITNECRYCAGPCLELPPQQAQPLRLRPRLCVCTRYKGPSVPLLGQQAREKDLCQCQLIHDLQVEAPQTSKIPEPAQCTAVSAGVDDMTTCVTRIHRKHSLRAVALARTRGHVETIAVLSVGQPRAGARSTVLCLGRHLSEHSLSK